VGFSADWLALREPADRAARDTGLLRRAAAAAGPEPVILDLGCGTGSTVRALAPHLPEVVQWRLVDNDPELLRDAGAAVSGAHSLHHLDIQALDDLPLDGVTLVTGSALLDLVTKQWLLDVAHRVRTALYFALSYDGVMRWDPEDPRDVAVTNAFNRHQQGDKGMGLALGPHSVEVAQEILGGAGFDVAVASSPWQLGLEQAALHRELVAGIALAAEEAGESGAHSWGEMRIASGGHTTCTIGHGDILAIPISPPTEGPHAGN